MLDNSLGALYTLSELSLNRREIIEMLPFFTVPKAREALSNKRYARAITQLLLAAGRTTPAKKRMEKICSLFLHDGILCTSNFPSER
jgi:hypothetical protein